MTAYVLGLFVAFGTVAAMFVLSIGTAGAVGWIGAAFYGLGLVVLAHELRATVTPDA